MSAGACVRPRLEGSLKAASPERRRERELEREGGVEEEEAIVPVETMGAARRHAALRT